MSVVDVTTDRPGVLFTDADGAEHEVRCDYLVGADGSRSICRQAVPESERTQYFREYPFAWFGILCEAPPSAPELIYNHSDRGFALISQRTPTLQRMYFQCDPHADVADWSDDRIWEELQSRLNANGHTLHEGPITSKTVLPFRSFVQEPMRYGNLLLAGDAAHTVPPTGAKGLNLALADVKVLAEELERAVVKKDASLLDDYSDARAGPGLEGPALLLLDDHDAARAPRGHAVRRTPPGRRAGLARRPRPRGRRTWPRATPAGRTARQCGRSSYQSSTRSARSVFHRLGCPSPPSNSNWVSPGWVFSSSQVPSGCRLSRTSCTASAIRSSGASPVRRKWSRARSTS